MGYNPQPQTILFVSLFVMIYGVYLTRNALIEKLDFYDFAILSLVAVFPALMVFFPETTVTFSHFLGVEFPFVILFGALFFIVFTCLHRLILAAHHFQNRETVLVQGIAQLKEKLARLETDLGKKPS